MNYCKIDSETLDYVTERNPLKILDELKNNPLLKNNKDFEMLYNFIQYRMENPDPRAISKN